MLANKWHIFNQNFIDMRVAYFLILQIAFLALVLEFHKAAFKYDWHPKIDLWGNILIICAIMLVNIILNYYVQLKIMTAFFLAGMHFTFILKIFSFGHVMYEVHKVLRAKKSGTFDSQYAGEAISADVF